LLAEPDATILARPAGGSAVGCDVENACGTFKYAQYDGSVSRFRQLPI